MTVKTTSKITVPKIQVYAPGDLNRLNTFEFEGKIGTEIENFGKQYHELHKGSISLRDQATLFQVYLLSELGELDQDFPGEVKDVAYKLFNQKGYGNVTDDACDYNRGDKGMKKVKETDRRVRWIVHPKGLRRTEEGWEAILGKPENIYHILLPKPGYVECTVDGAYRPDTGTPFSTVETRRKAEDSWTNKGFDMEFAGIAVSYFLSREEEKGTSAVARWFYFGGGGRFYVSAGGGPGSGDPRVGSFPASRRPSGARLAPGKGLVVLDEEKFKTLTESAEELAAFLKSLKE